MTHNFDRPLDIVLFGFGALGHLVVDCLKAGHPMLTVVGAVDTDPAKAGKRLAELRPDFARAGDARVWPTLAACRAALARPADIALHMTESEIPMIEADLIGLMDAGMNVVSASEAMFHPALRHPGAAARIDASAKANGVSITGVGINPGFAFDALPLMLARTTTGVSRIAISRTIDVTGTGPGDIDHVGYGLHPDVFRERIASGRIVGHMGGPESVACLAERLDLDIDRVEEGWETETSNVPVDSGTEALGMIPPGHVVGITQTIRGMRRAETIVDLRLVMYYVPERFGLEAADVIEIVGAHHVRARLKPAALSLFGAANTIVNACHDVAAAKPGLASMLDFGIAGARRGGHRHVLDPARETKPGVVALKRVPV